MPVLVNEKACLNRDHCFAAAGCPYDAYIHNNLKRTWEVDATICGDCPGPCINFCDQDAVLWANDLAELKLVRAQLDGTMTSAEADEARLKHKEELRTAEAAAKRKTEEAKQGAVVHLSRANFEQELLRSAVPVAVDCWADWCGPCKQFSPVFEATAVQYAGVVKFTKLNTEEEPALAAGLGVQALPTVLVFYKGQLANAVEGALSAQQFQQWLYQTLAGIRQYEAQFSSEAEHAIEAAVKNLGMLDGGNFGPDPDDPVAPPNEGAQGASASVDINTRSSPQPPRGEQPPQRQDDGKRTNSGLYIP